LDPALHIREASAAMDEDRLSEGSIGVGEQKRVLGGRQDKSDSPVACVLDALQVTVDHVMEDPLAGSDDREKPKLLVPVG